MLTVLPMSEALVMRRSGFGRSRGRPTALGLALVLPSVVVSAPCQPPWRSLRRSSTSTGDVRVLAEWISEEPITGEVLPEGLGGEIRMVLDPYSERTLPQLWIQSDMDTWREEHGLQRPGELNHAPGQRFGAFDPER